MLVTLVGLGIVVAASIYIAWPLLGDPGEDLSVPSSEASALVREKNAALDAIGEIDFDHRVGKISDEDHAMLRRDLERRALDALSALDGDAGPDGRGEDALPGSTAARGFCPACGASSKPDARFCTGCGKKMSAERSARGPTTARVGEVR